MSLVRQLIAVPFYLLGALFLKLGFVIGGPESQLQFALKLKEKLAE